MATNLSDRVSRIGSYAVTKPLLSITNSDDTLRVSIPSYIIDSARDDVVFAFGILSFNGVPNSN